MRQDNASGRQEDFDLIALFNEGDEDAFARIVERHSGRLINFLYRYTQDRATSEDIAQEAFLRLYKAAPDLKPDAKLSTIIYKIAYNLAVDHARRNNSRAAKAPTQSLDTTAETREPAAPQVLTPDILYEKAQQHKELAAKLAELPGTQQSAIILKVYENHSYAEIAEILGITVSAVESLLFRARKSLANNLKTGDR